MHPLSKSDMKNNAFLCLLHRVLYTHSKIDLLRYPSKVKPKSNRFSALQKRFSSFQIWYLEMRCASTLLPWLSAFLYHIVVDDLACNVFVIISPEAPHSYYENKGISTSAWKHSLNDRTFYEYCSKSTSAWKQNWNKRKFILEQWTLQCK